MNSANNYDEKPKIPSEGSLTSIVMKSGVWMVAARLINRGTRIVTTTILAHLLTPTEFGLIAVGLLAVAFVKIFGEFGIQQALIKESEENTSDFLNTAWITEATRGLLLSVIVYLSASLLSVFFSSPKSESVIRALAIIPLLNGLTSVRMVYLQKNLMFRKQFLYEISGIFAPLLVSIPLAILLKNVWALVIGSIATEILRLIISYCLMPYAPRISFNISYFMQMFSFGKWILLGGIVSYFSMQIDTIYVAKFLETNILGIYFVAFNLTNKPVIEFSKSLNKVFFPAFSRVSYDPIRVKHGFKKSINVLYSLVIPVSVGIILISEDFVEIFLGNDWLEMIPAMSILSIAALLRGLGVPAGSLFNGIGSPNLSFYNSIVRLIVLVASLLIISLPIFENKLVGVSTAVLLSNAFFFIHFVILTYRHTKVTISDWISVVTPLGLSTALMFFVVTILSAFIDNGISRLFFSMLCGVIVYFSSLFVFWKCFKSGPIHFYLSFLNKN